MANLQLPDENFFLEAVVGMVESNLAGVGFAFDAPLVAAVSGGADSVALLLLLVELKRRRGVPIIAAHLNHKLRGEADEEERRVSELCERLHVPLTAKAADVAALARRNRKSLEAAGRSARHEFLASVLVEAGAWGVATGHTHDDHIETILMNVLRGTGTLGLAGIHRSSSLQMTRPVNLKLRLVRPLLSIDHEACKRVCTEYKVDWNEDASNSDERFTRNRVRARLVPRLKEAVPGFEEHLAALSEYADSEQVRLRTQLEDAAVKPATCGHGVVRVARSEFNSLSAELGAYLLRTIWRSVALHSGIMLERHHVRALVDLAAGASGRTVCLPGGAAARASFKNLELHGPGGSFGCETVRAPKRPTLIGPNARLELENGFLVTTELTYDDPAPGSRWAAGLNFEQLRGQMWIRGRRPGDRFQPKGRRTPMKLKEFLISEHVPVWERDGLPLLETARGIAWVGGCRVAEWAKWVEGVSPCLRIEVKRESGAGCC